MPFRINARTIFHLGADLISSDSIALYELIKNAFDAESPEVEIRCVIGCPSDKYFDLHRELLAVHDSGKQISADTLVQWRERIAGALDALAPGVDGAVKRLKKAENVEALLSEFEETNFLEVADTGTGMTFDELGNVYLTIGTTRRLREKEAQRRVAPARNERPILGDKGVGRLAAMHLGTRLFVTTATKKDDRWSYLRIDWRDFLEDPDADLEAIDVAPEVGKAKSSAKEHGTTIRVSSLAGAWTQDKLRELAALDLAKLSDPFTKSKFPLLVSFNGNNVKVPKFEELLTQYAQADCTAEFVAEGPNSRLEGIVDYRQRERKHAFSVSGPKLLSVADASTFSAITSVGPFKVRFYWFNRQTLRKLEDVPDLPQVLALQEQWAGGLMVYRDGFRVHPYGTGDDDWLDLDRNALAAQGYKVNRRQIVGRVTISSRENPDLVDQTNREGLRDSPQRSTLILLLQHVMLGQFKPFLDQCDEEAKAGGPITAKEIEGRVEGERKRLRSAAKQLKSMYPQLERETGVLQTLTDAIEKIGQLMEQARRQVESYEMAQDRVLHLAATGLLVEILAHELNRATRHALLALKERDAEELSEETSALLSTLEAELKTLQKRLRIIDPLATAGRQVKETFDLVEWVRDICASHTEQFRIQRVVPSIKVVPAKAANKTFQVRMVKGMVVQILENLFSNSLYWLEQQSRLEKGFKPRIDIEIDTEELALSVTDNGPGVDPDDRERIFQPYVTMKPANEGKGLGLFISREVAKYHKAKLELSRTQTQPGKLNTFVLHLGAVSV